MKLIFPTTIAILFIGIYNINAQTTVNLTADFDAAIGYHDGNNTANTNFGSAVQNAAYTIPGNSGPLNINRALIHFDLSSIPQNAIITNARLNLYALGPIGSLSGHSGQNNSAYVKRVTSSWSENTVTWNTQPSTTIQNEVTLPASTNPLQDYLNIDVTSLTQDMISNSNNGFLLKQVNEVVTNVLLFCSIDYSDPNKFPTLEITYEENCLSLITDTDAAIGYHDGNNTASTNFGSAVQNAAYTIPGNNGPLNINRALIQFDMSTIPQNAIITSANLNLYALGPIGSLTGHSGQNNSAYIKRVTAPWSENTVTWNNQPATTIQNEVTLAPSTNSTQDYLNIDVKLLVQDMLINNNYGFLLKQVNEVTTNVLLFCSSDYSDPNKFPSLEICYKLPSSIAINNDINRGFKVFPNPTSNILNLEFEETNINEDVLIELFTIDGKIIKSIANKKINTSLKINDIDTGIYFLKITTDNKTSTERIILTN